MSVPRITCRQVHRTWAWVLALALWGTVAEAKVPFIAKWSPHNAERPKRQLTLYIILHTTEGPAPGSLQKLYDNGEANFFVDPTGRLYGIIDRRRVAFHAGRSMWRGRSNLDDVSIGIEVAGYYTRDFTAAQYTALRDLLGELQVQYGIEDINVLSHSMVAYGAPNRWHRRSHRGRKRCGMNFASPAVRQRLGLTSQPTFDPDVRDGRLAVGDPYLADKLYGQATRRAAPPVVAKVLPVVATTTPRPPVPDVTENDETNNVIGAGRSAWDIARDAYNTTDARYVFPDGKWVTGDQVRDWTMIPPGTRVVLMVSEADNARERTQRIGSDGATARDLAGDEYASARTIYFLPDGRVRTGAELTAAELEALPPKTAVLVGYTLGGSITAKRSAFDVCGPLWNHPSTIYRMADGVLVPGDRVDENNIPRGTRIFFRN